MASSFLTKKAEEQAKKSQANAKNLQKQAKEDGRPWIPGGTTGSRTASDFLYNKAKERNATVASGTYGRRPPALPAPAQNNMAAPAAAGITGAVAGAIPQVQLPPPTQGNIDLNNRPVYRNPDGTISTVDSFSTNIDGMEVLLPQIGRDANGNAVRWTQDQAIDNYLKTGEYLGKFATVDEANRYAEWLHNQQAEMYGQQPTQTNAQSYYNDTLRASLQQQIEAKTKERDQYDPSSRQWRKANRQLGALYGQQAQAASQAAMPGSTPVLGSLLTPDSDVDVQRKKVSALYREASTLSDDHTPEGQKAYMEKLAEAEEANRVLHDMGGRYGLAEGAVTTAENLGAGVAGAVRGIGNALGYVGQLQARTAMMQADPYLRMWGQDEVADANAAEIQRARDNGLQSAAEMLESVGVSGAGKVDQLIQNFQQTAAEHAQASGKVTQAIANTANGVGGMVPSILSNIAVPGSGLWVMAGQAFGNATEEAIKAGATDEKAVLYGGAVAAVEVLTEKMFGGIPGLNVGSLDDAIENAVKKSVGTAAEQRAIMFFVDALGEGAEEFVSEFADWGLNKWLVGSDERSFRDVNKDAWYSALIGALTSVAMSTPVEVIKAMGPKGLAERVAQEVEFRVGKHEDAIASYQEAAEKYGLMSPEAVQAQQRARETGLQARQAKADLQRTLGADPEQVRQASQLLGRAQTADATYDLGGTGTETTNAGIMLPTAQENYTLPTLASEQNRGIMSAEENAQEEVFDGREQSPGREGRQGSLAPAEQGGELGTRTEGTEVREPGYAEESGRDSGQAGEALRTVSEYKSGADLGIETAVSAAEDKTKTLREVVKYNDAEQKIIDYGKAHGQDVHFYTGDLWVKGKNGKQYKVRGLISGDGKTVWIKSDHAVLSATQIYKHENYHAAIKANPAIREDGINRIKNKYKRNENGLRQLIKTYAELYAMSDEQVSDDYILEEILCDAHAGIDVLTTTKRGGLKTVDLSKEANKALETGKKSAAESSQAKASRGHWKPKFDQTEWSIANSLVNNYSGQDINETTKYAFASKKGKSVFVIYSTERADDKTLLYGVSGKDASVALSYMQEVFDGATEEVDRIRDAVSAYIARTKNKPNGRNSDSPKFRNGGTENGNAVLSERGVGEQTVSGVDSGQSNRDNGELKALKNTLANGRTFYSRDVTEEKAPRQYNIPEGFAAYIRNTSAKFVDKILNGQKTVETRNDRTLDSYIGKWMPILKTETGEVVGEAHIKGVKEYESVQDFRDDFAAHQVPKNSKFDWDGTGHKYGYIIDGVRKFDQPVQPAGEKYGRIAKGIEKAVENSEPIRADSEALASREFDDDYMANAEKANEKNKYADAKAMKQARKDRKRIHDYMEKIADMLPPDITGDTFYSDSSYGGSEENTTICPRTLAYEEFLDAVAEELGRPLTVEDTTFICQEAMAMTDKPECLYCYVAMDRKAYREYLGNYIEQRDAFLKDIRDGMEPGLVKPVKKSEANGNRTIPKDTAYGKFLNGRANTVNMYNRAKLWMETENLITKKDLASIASMNKAAQDPALRAQIDDAQSYAQSASWAKKKNGFAAYNNHILKWSKAKVDKLNKHYGLRMYSFSDYSPAFILENMQQITDAAVKGLKVLGYTKELDFVRIFAPTGMNINISVFGYNDWSSGQVAMDAMQGADWTQAQELRAKYPNVGCTFVATNDAQVEWALAQDWIDVVIPFHIVRTGANVASMFGWKNYTDMSADKKNPNWKKGNKKSIYPSEHQNDKDLYLELCQENNLTPRFEKWVDNPNYMKLVNETRQSDAETKPVQPVFDMTVAEASLDEMVKRGGYVQHIGGTSENMRTLASETAEKLAGKTKEEVRSAVEDRARYSLDMVEPVQPKSDEWERGATTDEVRAAHPTLYAVDEDATEERNPTQVKGTIGTYRKLYKILESEGFNGTILDASSGLGYGTEAGRSEFGFDVDDIEPYPGADYTPKYTDYSKLKKKYDVVISNAVLNVLPQDQRDALVVKMGELLSDGGRMFVNVRGKDVLNASGKIPINEGQMEYFIPRTAKTGSYQKGFTADELKAYLEDALGDGFSVEKTNKFGAVSAVVTKGRAAYSREANDDYNAVVRENKRLKKQVEYWQGQTRATEGWKADAKQEARVTKDILKSTSSKADADEMTKRITQLHEDLSNGKLTYEQGKEVATQIASDIISKSERLVGKDVETYREARKIIKSTPQTHVAYNQLQALMGNELFPDVLGDEARKEIIDDVMGAMKPFVDNPYDLQKAIVIESVADDIVNAGMEMRQAKPTIVDVERAKTAEAKAEGARALEEQRLVDRMFYERKISEIRRQRDEKIEAVKQHQRDVNEHRREMREEASDRRRLLKLVKRLQGKTVDPVTKAQLPEILKTLDTVSVNITDKSIQNLTELRQWYHDKTTQGSDIYDPNFIPDKATLDKLDRLEKVMNGGSIGDMSIMQVRELTEVLLNIEHNMLEARKFQKSKLAIDNYEAGMRLIQDIDNAVPGGINRELSPLRAARRIAGYNDGAIEGTEASPVITLMQECIAGERAAQMYTREATHMLSKYLNDKAFMRGLYGRRAQEITITGYDARTGEKKSVAITPAMRVSLYLHSLNDDNMRHVQEGGVLIPDMRLYKKGNLAEAYAADNRLKLTKQNVASICANMTEQERGFARALWRYFNEYAPKSLNEASVELDGYEKFNVENYFPISVDSNFLGQDYQQMVMESDGSLTHPGFGEERIQSSKPIYLRDVNDVFRTAVEQNAAYACKAVPLSNLNKLINVQQVGAVDSVSAALDRRFTAKKKSPVTVSGADYLAKFMRDYAGNRGGKKSGIDKMLAKIRSNYSGAVLTLAAGTAIKQAASYPTAAAVVSTKSLTQALNLARTVDTSFIDKYTATFTQRKEGFSSVEQAELSQEGRHIPKVLNWIQAVDVATTWALKRAAAIEVQHTTNLKPGTREYEQAVVDMYQRIIEETQPNYSTALRPDILRSDSALERALVMFATQPMQNFGILYDAVNDFSAKRRAYMNTESASAKKAYQAAAKKLGRAIGSQLASSLVFALMQAAYDWFRKKDDKYKDDGEWTWESFAKGIGLNMLTNGAGLFIGGKVALEFMEVFADKISGQKIFGTQAYGFDVAELEAITDAVKSSVNAVGTVSSAVRSAAAGESVDYEGLARKIWTATEDALKLAGVPLENATTMVTSVAKKVMTASMGPYIGDYYALRIGADPASSKAAFYDNLYACWKKAPNSTMRELYDIMLQDGFTPDGVKSAMESRAKKDEGVGSVKELKTRWPLK